MITRPETSIMGSSAAACVDTSLYPGQDNRRAKRRVNVGPPRKCDAIGADVCRRCGFPGPHPDWSNCVDALRDELARAEFATERTELLPVPAPSQAAAEPPAAEQPPAASVAVEASSAPAESRARHHHRRELRTNSCKIEPMNRHYTAVLTDLERIKADAENGIKAIRAVIARAPEAGSSVEEAPKARPQIRGKSSAGFRIVKFLEANPGTSYTGTEVAAGLGGIQNAKTIRNALQRLFRTGEIARPVPGRYQSKPKLVASR